MKSTWSRPLRCGTLGALMITAAGCVAANEAPPVAETTVETSAATAFSPQNDEIDRAPCLDDLLAPAVDENDPDSVAARALYELVGPSPVVGSGDRPAEVGAHPTGAADRRSAELPH